jgi:hypothetical protein
MLLKHWLKHILNYPYEKPIECSKNKFLTPSFQKLAVLNQQESLVGPK